MFNSREWNIFDFTNQFEVLIRRHIGVKIWSFYDCPCRLKMFGGDFVSIEDLFLAIFKSASKIAQILKDQGATEKDIKASIAELRKAKE